MSPTSRTTWLRPMARAFLAGGMGISDQLLPPSYGDVTGTSQYALEFPICVPAWAAPTREQPFPRLSTWSPDDIRRVAVRLFRGRQKPSEPRRRAVSSAA